MDFESIVERMRQRFDIPDPLPAGKTLNDYVPASVRADFYEENGAADLADTLRFHDETAG